MSSNYLLRVFSISNTFSWSKCSTVVCSSFEAVVVYLQLVVPQPHLVISLCSFFTFPSHNYTCSHLKVQRWLLLHLLWPHYPCSCKDLLLWAIDCTQSTCCRTWPRPSKACPGVMLYVRCVSCDNSLNICRRDVDQRVDGSRPEARRGLAAVRTS